jgi:hypothetical protein
MGMALSIKERNDLVADVDNRRDLNPFLCLHGFGLVQFWGRLRWADMGA